MQHLTIYFYCDGSLKRRRLARRYTTTSRLIESRHSLRREALDLAVATAEGRVKPTLQDIVRLEIFDGHTKVQVIHFQDPNGGSDDE